MLKDLRLQTHHEGQYLIVRSIVSPGQVMSVMSIVEDECGDAIMITLRHQDTSRHRDEILGEGMILAVKEPYLRQMSDGTHGIIVDYLSNYKYLSRKDNLTTGMWQGRLSESQDNAKSWNTAGKNLAETEMYFSAITRYVLQNCSRCLLWSNQIAAIQKVSAVIPQRKNYALSNSTDPRHIS
jgi:hypothetical protein